jgi:DNA replication ATP-dependent helicase Dna2
LRQFVKSEAEAQRFDLERQWSQPLAARLSKGVALEGLQVAQIRRDGVVRLSCQTNESRFREGDLLALHRGNPFGQERIECTLDYDDETELEVSVTSGPLPLLREHPHGWIADESMLDLSRFYLQALDQTADTLRGRELVLPLLTGAKAPGLDYARYERGWSELIEAGLNESQAEAAALAYAADLAYLIQGPPGTGKTFVLAHLARLMVADGQRVLVTGLTHRAINNALNKIVRVDAGLPVCKVGSRTRSADLLAQNYENFAESGFGDLAGGYIVGATPFATQSERLSNIEFDLVIFDEASQVTLPLAIMGMLAGAKYIFIGDERQLPPVNKSKSQALARTSIFGYLNGRGYETMLTTTYRMNDALTAWPSKVFYGGAIQPAPGVGERRLRLPKTGSRWDFALDPQQPAVFLDLAHHNTTVRSRGEAEVVCDLILTLIGLGIRPAEIGVVVPYRAQGRLIRNLLRLLLPSREMLDDLTVDTVERMQGQEREVVLVSLTTSSPAFATHLAEFFFQPERLNVAITRPRTKLILVGSRHVLNATPEALELAESVALLRDLIACCKTFALPGRMPV